ncbi:MAG: sulfurtransferase [Clostridiaceae bacterium]|jgi:thiosulfate/3-mercaptopyruvate sulfurtransferase|nr:sulfurtransferase [Clostridiaceae bacterium]
MKKKIVVLLTAVMMFSTVLSGTFVYGGTPEIDPIVSTGWLQNNMNLQNLVIIDIRTADQYEAGHIANSVSIPFVVPFSAWITMEDELLLELPENNELFSMLGSFGINENSNVVVVGGTADPYDICAAPRVADTLIYAGVENVAILDGGYAKWASEGRPVTTEVPTVTAKYFKGNKIDKNMFVSMDYVEKKIGKSIIIDARDAEVYNGEIIEPYAQKPGHIPTAKSLPAPLMWNEDGTYKSASELKQLAESIGNTNDHIIVYCGVGGYASAWWFVLTEVLEYKHVKFYDGSAQEWSLYNEMVLD